MSRELLKRCKDFMDCIDLPRPEKLYAALDAELSNPEPEPEPEPVEKCHPDEHDSNVRLIAAAPELLKALEAMISDLKLRAEIDSRGYRVLNISDGVLMRAEKAIAKAKGEL